ncbi:LysR family transcriptional regulator [Erwinia sp. Leaf53]|uniref:LysR family transcriptional regulator n=1 Tax=Erwinia sp. Leaf53 TaxID=1736225 RepID=UPI0006FF4A62|nr:LysR family transcriptional regulator [Erwinia sp. Leaf53]KQN57768.1 LysR family transcriptional regulator [Erwinia sp. Leaf53]
MDNLNRKLPSIKQLQCFLVVAQELNFRKAADRLRMTQPPLTRQIKSLEETLGYDLFIRNTHDVRLTESGVQLTGRAAKLLDDLGSFIGDAHHEKDQLRIGLTRTLNFNNIPQVSEKIKQLISEEEIEIQNQTSAQLLQSLSKGQMDMVITGERSLPGEEEFSFYWIYQEPLLVAMPSAHPASLQEEVSLADVADLPLFWFARNANPAFYDKCERYLRQLPFVLKRIKEPDDSLVLLAGVARSKGFALLPQSMCTFNQQGLCYRRLNTTESQLLNIDVYIAIRKRENRERVIHGIGNLTAEEWEEPQGRQARRSY